MSLHLENAPNILLPVMYTSNSAYFYEPNLFSAPRSCMEGGGALPPNDVSM